jgi:hypothetical protein
MATNQREREGGREGGAVSVLSFLERTTLFLQFTVMNDEKLQWTVVRKN